MLTFFRNSETVKSISDKNENLQSENNDDGTFDKKSMLSEKNENLQSEKSDRLKEPESEKVSFSKVLNN